MSKYVPYEDVGKMALTMVGVSNTTLIYALQGLPSIDIVRCAECKRWSYSDLIESHNRCDRTMKLTKPDDFCSRGERKEEQFYEHILT